MYTFLGSPVYIYHIVKLPECTDIQVIVLTAGTLCAISPEVVINLYGPIHTKILPLALSMTRLSWESGEDTMNEAQGMEQRTP